MRWSFALHKSSSSNVQAVTARCTEMCASQWFEDVCDLVLSFRKSNCRHLLRYMQFFFLKKSFLWLNGTIHLNFSRIIKFMTHATQTQEIPTPSRRDVIVASLRRRNLPVRRNVCALKIEIGLFEALWKWFSEYAHITITCPCRECF